MYRLHSFETPDNILTYNQLEINTLSFYALSSYCTRLYSLLCPIVDADTVLIPIFLQVALDTP